MLSNHLQFPCIDTWTQASQEIKFLTIQPIILFVHDKIDKMWLSVWNISSMPIPNNKAVNFINIVLLKKKKKKNFFPFLFSSLVFRKFSFFEIWYIDGDHT